MRLFELKEITGRIAYVTIERWKHITNEHPIMHNKI